MSIAQREFFGPVTVVIPFKDDDDAVRLANDSPYGLAGGVLVGQPLRAVSNRVTIADRLRFRSTADIPDSSPHSAFGGYKTSGVEENGELWPRASTASTPRWSGQSGAADITASNPLS